MQIYCRSAVHDGTSLLLFLVRNLKIWTNMCFSGASSLFDCFVEIYQKRWKQVKRSKVEIQSQLLTLLEKQQKGTIPNMSSETKNPDKPDNLWKSVRVPCGVFYCCVVKNVNYSCISYTVPVDRCVFVPEIEFRSAMSLCACVNGKNFSKLHR